MDDSELLSDDDDKSEEEGAEKSESLAAQRATSRSPCLVPASSTPFCSCAFASIISCQLLQAVHVLAQCFGPGLCSRLTTGITLFFSVATPFPPALAQLVRCRSGSKHPQRLAAQKNFCAAHLIAYDDSY